MDAHKETLSKILSLPTRLVAPLFQRPYVWSRSDNWEPLWEAFVEVLNRRLSEVKSRPYFLGAIVLDKIKGSTGAVPCREIIDGQQRMTTLQIMLEAGVAVFSECGFEHQSKQLRKLTRNDIDEDDGPDSEEQFKVWPTNADRAAFRNVMTGKASVGLMADAFLYFQGSIRLWLDAPSDGAKERAVAFVKAVHEDLLFVAIDLTDEDDDGQLIFETLNALGTPLLPSDLVKNLLFRAATTAGLNTDKLYNDYWLQFEDDAIYWRAKVKVGRRDRPRIDVFLQFYLTYKLGKEPNLSHQFRDYRDALHDGKFGSVEDAIRDFALHASLYRKYDEATTGNLGRLRHVLALLDLSVPTPLVLGVLANAEDVAQCEAMLETIESYFIRRFLCCLLTKNYNLITAGLITTLKKNGWQNDHLRAALIALAGNSTIWPDDELVFWRVNKRNSYRDLKSGGIAYVLARVEDFLRTAKSEGSWSYKTPLTIEHLMPQKWEANWPLDDPEDTDAKQRRSDLNNRMGNLTILTQGLNSAVSNGSWADKRKHLNQHTVLLMNSELASRETWTEADIEVRSGDLAQKFCQIWPR
ncbi:MAG: DUF262 domain-containing protein [Capsulimonas sp.]|uniref:DUF262 domain-containing protein n=1 Tax=Capsulimonas sp. TaxID=2494211 RepID=UPI003266A7C8